MYTHMRVKHGTRFFDGGEIRELRLHRVTSLASHILKENNRQRAAKPYKMAMNLAQVTQKKKQQT